jgi:hypothetical protein
MACQPLSPVPGEKSRTTDTYSRDINSNAAKIAFLQEYLSTPSDILATEFHIVYHDNSGGLVPGPSDWDIQAVIKVAPDDLPHWQAGLTPLTAEGVDLAWAYVLLPTDPAWSITSEPQNFQGKLSNHIVSTFAPEGIVFVRSWTK